MSGGSYDYAFCRISDLADSIREHGQCDCASPAVRKAFAAHLRKVSEAMRAIEWNDSCDGTGGWEHTEEELIRACVSPDAELRRPYQEPMLQRFEDGVFTCVVDKRAVAFILEAFGPMLGNAPNWASVEVLHPELGKLIISVQKAAGDTPIETVGKLRLELAAATKQRDDLLRACKASEAWLLRATPVTIKQLVANAIAACEKPGEPT